MAGKLQPHKDEIAKQRQVYCPEEVESDEPVSQIFQPDWSVYTQGQSTLGIAVPNVATEAQSYRDRESHLLQLVLSMIAKKELVAGPEPKSHSASDKPPSSSSSLSQGDSKVPDDTKAMLQSQTKYKKLTQFKRDVLWKPLLRLFRRYLKRDALDKQ